MDNLAKEAEAEVVLLRCPNGHLFPIVGHDPGNREDHTSCPKCGYEVAEYGELVVETIGYLFPNKLVLLPGDFDFEVVRL